MKYIFKKYSIVLFLKDKVINKNKTTVFHYLQILAENILLGNKNGYL